MKANMLISGLLIFSLSLFEQVTSDTTQQPLVRLYVFDGGILENMDPKSFGLEKEEVSISRMPVPCYLIIHPKGTLIWDAGAVPDTAWKYTGSPVQYIFAQYNIDITLNKPLRLQLNDIGYSPANITYLALSHHHFDHTANVNDFLNATWLVRQNEVDIMFTSNPPDADSHSSYSNLRNNKRIILNTEEYDIFGDGTVIIKAAPGHTPGHQVLFVRLSKYGNILLSGDLYHYPEQRLLDRVPTYEFNKEQTRASRLEIDFYLKKMNAELWIQHDFGANLKLKKAPEYYE